MNNIKIIEDLKIIFKYIKKINVDKKKILLLVILIFAVNILSLTQPFIIGLIVDSLTNMNIDNIKLLLLIGTILIILNIILTYLQNITLLKLVSKIEIETKNKIFTKIINKDIDYTYDYDHGTLINNIENDCNVISNLINQNISAIISIFNIIITGIILLKIEYRLTIVLIVMFPINGYIFLKVGRILKKQESTLRKLHDNYIVFLTETFNSINLYSIFGIRDNIINAFKTKNNNLYDIGINKAKSETKISSLTEVISSFSNIFVLVLGIYLVYKNELTVGLLVSFNSYSNSFKGELHSIARLNLIIQNMIVSLERIQYILSENTNITTSYKEFEINTLELKNITFKYDDKYILKNKTFEFSRGNLYYISGRSGVGKTTLLNIISGIEKNVKANIFINNKKVSNYELYMNNFIYIDQKNNIFSDTIYNNISLYRDIEKEKLESICKLLEIDDVIRNFPDGYNSIINLNGIDLSEGQKQRLCIARGLLGDQKSVYIFDEIISSLDKRISEKIILYLKELSKKSIVIVSSHKDLSEIVDVIEYSLL